VHLAQDGDQWQALVNKLMDLPIALKGREKSLA
jgi:hypothetical protein